MLIAVPAETDPGKGRVAATPETVKKFIGLGAKVVVQSGAGLASGILDANSGWPSGLHLHRLGHRLPQARRADERQADHAAAATSYSTSNAPMIPLYMYIYYSMFGLQRVGDLAWAASDM